MPVGDWQFWVVTLVALAVGAAAVRSLVPRKKRTTRISLTINRDKPA